MNLNIYEKIDIDKTKTWVNCTYKNLYSKEIKHYSMFTILKRYNPKEKCVDYFLVVSDSGDSEHKWDCITFTKSGILKINLFNLKMVLYIILIYNLKLMLGSCFVYPVIQIGC